MYLGGEAPQPKHPPLTGLGDLQQHPLSTAAFLFLYFLKEKIRFMPLQLREIGFHVENHATQCHGFQHEIQFQEIVVAWIQLTLFKNVFYRNIFSVSHFTVLYPYRPAGGGRGPTTRQEGRRDLHINKYNFFCAEAPGGSLPPGGGVAGSPPARQGGGRLPPQI